MLNKAIDYSEIEDDFLEYDDCEDVCDYKCVDINPNKELVYTKQEIAERSKRYINYQRNKCFEKACEYLRTHLWQNVDADNDPIVESVHNITLNNFIKDFKRYLEEDL